MVLKVIQTFFISVLLWARKFLLSYTSVLISKLRFRNDSFRAPYFYVCLKTRFVFLSVVQRGAGENISWASSSDSFKPLLADQKGLWRCFPSD